VAKFVLTIESDDPLEIASFLDRNKALTQDTRVIVPASEPLPVETIVEIQSEKPAKARKAKAEPAPSAAVEDSSSSSEPASATEEKSGATAAPSVNDLNEAVRKAVSNKTAQAAVQALKDRFGTPSPGQIPPERYAEAIEVLENL
jgi:hypothetical protein